MADDTPTPPSRRRRWLRRAGLLALAVLTFGFGATRCLVRSAEERFPRRGKILTVEGLAVRYIERGEGRPVVLLHGAFGGIEDWEATVFDELSTRFRVIALDRPGHGYSERPVEVGSPAVQARIVHGALAALDVERPLLVGFSWGGTVAVAYALEYPDEPSAVVTISAPLREWKGWTSPAYTLGTVPLLGPLLAHTLATPVATVLSRGSVSRAFSPAPVAAHFDRSPIPLALRPGAYLANAEDMTILKDELFRMHGRYPGLRTPFVVVHGEGDEVAWASVHAIPFTDAVAGSELVLVPGGGHQLPYSHPEVVIAAVERAAARFR